MYMSDREFWIYSSEVQMKSGLLYLLDILQLLSNESLEINDNIFAVGKHLPNTSFTIVMISAQNP